MTGLAAPHRHSAAPVPDAAANRLVKLVDHAAIRHNVTVLLAAAGDRTVLPVIKGDAYSLGAVPIARTLRRAGTGGLAVDTVAEGLALREAGIGGPILVMDVDVPENAAACVAAGLTPTIARPEHARCYADLARERGAPVTAWLRTNLGFNRFGPRDGFDELLADLAEYQGPVRFASLFAHLTSSAWEQEETHEQATAFAGRLAAARAVLGPDLDGSLAATHGLLHPVALRGTASVRPGIGLYGAVASTARQLTGWAGSGLDQLRPACGIRARVLDIVTVTRAEGLGYDRSAPVVPGQRVASVAIGFSRGITAAAKGFSALVHGRRCRWIGKPGMDCTQLDVSDVPQVRAGDWVTVLGSSGGLTQTAEDLSAELGCSLYELMATLHMPVRHTGIEDEERNG